MSILQRIVEVALSLETSVDTHPLARSKFGRDVLETPVPV